jgi:hypothetical protein
MTGKRKRNNNKQPANNKRKSQNPPKRRKRMRRNRKIAKKGGQLPLSFYRNIERQFRVIRSDPNSMVVSGRDLVYSIPDVHINQGNKVLTVIPSNPAYWRGTRISTLAVGYQQYRPLRFTVHYVPIVSALNQGTVFGGTIWNNQTIPDETLQQTLVTTPGGMSTQVFKPYSRSVPCRAFLPKNLFSMAGTFNERSNPFNYVAIAVANFQQEQRITPGYFWVSYTYIFKNPTGNNTVYANTGMISLSALQFRLNTSALLCSSMKYVQFGLQKTLDLFTEVQIEVDPDGDLIALYNGTYVPLTDETKLWVFQNYGTNDTTQVPKHVFDLHFTTQAPLVDNQGDPYYIIQAYRTVAYMEAGTFTLVHANSKNINISQSRLESTMYQLTDSELNQLAGMQFDLIGDQTALIQDPNNHASGFFYLHASDNDRQTIIFPGIEPGQGRAPARKLDLKAMKPLIRKSQPPPETPPIIKHEEEPKVEDDEEVENSLDYESESLHESEIDQYIGSDLKRPIRPYELKAPRGSLNNPAH